MFNNVFDDKETLFTFTYCDGTYEKIQKIDLKLHYDFILKMKKTTTTSSTITIILKKKYDVCTTYSTKNKQLKEKFNILYKLN